MERKPFETRDRRQEFQKEIIHKIRKLNNEYSQLINTGSISPQEVPFRLDEINKQKGGLIAAALYHQSFPQNNTFVDATVEVQRYELLHDFSENNITITIGNENTPGKFLKTATRLSSIRLGNIITSSLDAWEYINKSTVVDPDPEEFIKRTMKEISAIKKQIYHIQDSDQQDKSLIMRKYEPLILELVSRRLLPFRNPQFPNELRVQAGMIVKKDPTQDQFKITSGTNSFTLPISKSTENQEKMMEMIGVIDFVDDSAYKSNKKPKA